MAAGGEADVGLRLRLSGRQEVRQGLQDVAGGLGDVANAGGDVEEATERARKGLAGLADSRTVKGLAGVGGALGKGLAAGIIAAGAVAATGFVAAVRAGIAQQDLTRGIAAQFDLSAGDAAAAGSAAGLLYAQNYGESRDEAAQALGTAKLNLGFASFDDAGLQQATKDALNLASVFDVDVAESTRAAGQLMRTGLAADATQAFDLITKGFQSGADRGEDFLDTLNEYGTTFAGLGLSGEQVTGVLAQALNAGVSTADFAADALRETGIRIRGGGAEIDAALQSIGLDAGAIERGFNAGGTAATDALDKVFDALRTTTDAQTQTTAGAALLGGQFEDIGTALLAIDPSAATSALGQVDGAAARLDGTLGSGLGPRFETLQRTVGQFATEAGTAIVDRWGPGVEGVLARVTTGITMLQGDLPGLGAAVRDAFAGDGSQLGSQLGQAFVLTPQQTAGLTGFIEQVRPGLQTVVDAARNIGAALAAAPVSPLQAIAGAVRFAADHADAVKGLAYVVGPLALGIGAVTIALKAYEAGVLVVRGVTAVATAAQWLWNAALTANPIGLVVAAIALLVGGLVWFFTKTDTGRAAWDKLTGAFRSGVDWITGTAVPAIRGGLGDALQWAREKFDKVRDGVAGFVDKVKDGVTWVAKLADKLTGGLVGKALGAVGVDLEGRATGGPVAAGRPYVVGEEGPELFVPGLTGRILNDVQVRGLLEQPAATPAQLLSLHTFDATPGVTAADVPTVAQAAMPTTTRDVDEFDLSDDENTAARDGLVAALVGAFERRPVILEADGRELARTTVDGMHRASTWQ